MAKIFAAAAPVAPPAPSSKPGTKAPEAAKPEKKKKVKRAFYPGLEAKPLTGDDGKPKLDSKGRQKVRPTKKLGAVPSDFDIKVHKPLGKNDFEDESLWYELRAVELEKKAGEFRRKGADLKALGTVEDRKSAKKLLELKSRMDELMTELKGKGIDLSALEAKIEADIKAKAAAKAEKAA